MKSKKTISSSKLAKGIMRIKSFLFNEMHIYLIEPELHTEHNKRSCCTIVQQLLLLLHLTFRTRERSRCRECGEPETTSTVVPTPDVRVGTVSPVPFSALPEEPSRSPASSARKRSTSSAGAVTTRWLTTPASMSPAVARRRRLVPPTGTSALGTLAPRREPEPAAVRTATALPGAAPGRADD